MNNYFGFVYIWRDSKNKMFYIGSHMGLLNDGYIGSSIRLKRAYKIRPNDFKRRILFFIKENDSKKLREEEERWLKMIKLEELGIKYYNLKLCAHGGNVVGLFDKERMKKYKETLRMAANTGGKHYKARRVVCNYIEYESIAEAKLEIGFNPQRRLKSRNYLGFYYADQPPISQEDLDKWSQKRKIDEEKRKRASMEAQKNMSEFSKRQRAQKAVITRTRNGLGYYKKVSEKLKARPGKRVSVDGVIYEKGRIAAELLGITYANLKSRIKSLNFPSYFYVGD